MANDVRTRPLPTPGRQVLLAVAILSCLWGCSSEPDGKVYPIRGEVVAVAEPNLEVTLRHEPIAGYMDAMTMSFSVARRDLLGGIAPGDAVEGVILEHDRGVVLIQLAKRALPAPSAAATPTAR
jgi:Cu/Ag efflux protein CusF